jgi:hypothetical protein
MTRRKDLVANANILQSAFTQPSLAASYLEVRENAQELLLPKRTLLRRLGGIARLRLVADSDTKDRKAVLLKCSGIIIS